MAHLIKYCSKCNKTKSVKCFQKDKSRKDGYYLYCKECESIRKRKSYDPNKELERKLRYEKENPGHSKKIKKEYYEKTVDIQRKKAKERHEKNKKRDNQATQRYYQEHKEERRVYFRNRLNRLRKEDLNFKMRNILSQRFQKALKDQLAGKRISSVKDLGCSLDFVVKYIQSKWLPGMSWDNYGFGVDKWNIDHIKALANFDLRKKSEQKKACHYTNLQPLWQLDNLRKGRQ